MEETYFITLGDFGKMHRTHEDASIFKLILERDGYWSWNKDDPELDNLRKAAVRALEDYEYALAKRIDVEKDRLYDKLEDSDKVLNLKNLFK